VSKNDYGFTLSISFVNEICGDLSACGSIECRPSTGG
jgi:hypothetical protein